MFRRARGNYRNIPPRRSGPVPFDGNFASLFPGAYQVLQSDRGLTFGGTMLDTGGAGPVITLTGALVGPPIPIWVKCQFGGSLGVWIYEVYYDGLGVTPAMTGASAAAIPLTGAGDGLTLNIAAGSAVSNNIWKATCSGLADQSGNGKHAIQATAAKQPLIAVGANNLACVLGDGVDDFLGTAGLNLPAPGTTPYHVFMVVQWLATAGNPVALGNGDFSTSNLMYVPNGASARQNNNGADVTVACVPTAWNIVEIRRSNNAADTFKVGSASVIGNAGNGSVISGAVLQSPGIGSAANAKIHAVAYTPNLPDWAAVRAAVTSKYAGVVTV